MTTLAINHADSWQFEDKRFYRLLWLGFALWLIFAVLVPALKVPAPSREVLEQLPPQLAKVVLEQRKAPPPPEPEPVEQQVIEPPKPEPKPEPVAADNNLIKHASVLARR